MTSEISEFGGSGPAPQPTVDSGTTVPERYAREIRAREQAHERCPVDVFVAGKNARYSWPYRLVNAEKARPSLAETCETLIIDSVVGDPYYAVDDILDTAHRLDAEYVIGKDWPAFAAPDDEGPDTLDAYRWTMTKYKRHDCDAELIVPLQPPYDKQTVDSLRNSGVEHFALGGLRDKSGQEQVELIRSFREIAGFGVQAHGLGVGTTPELIAAIRESVVEDPQRPLLDSFDISTPENAVVNNKIPNKRWDQSRVPLPTGEDSTTIRAGFSEAIARMLEYELSTQCDGEMFAGERRLSQF
ncbi:MAG TPA: hypothetical protein VFJ06_00275 [Halococcus sp.]|nr:hypothetical protein [Halococcus sp.]